MMTPELGSCSRTTPCDYLSLGVCLMPAWFKRVRRIKHSSPCRPAHTAPPRSCRTPVHAMPRAGWCSTAGRRHPTRRPPARVRSRARPLRPEPCCAGLLDAAGVMRRRGRHFLRSWLAHPPPRRGGLPVQRTAVKIAPFDTVII